MDADRVRAYLQVACAGLGFDIGEVWWMSNESGTSTVAAIGVCYFLRIIICICLRFIIVQSSDTSELKFAVLYRVCSVCWMHQTSNIHHAEDRETRSDTNNTTTGLGDGLSQSSTSIPSSTAINSSRRTAPPKKRFLQLYTSKAYNDQRSKLVQPRAESSTSDDDTCEAVNSSLDDNNDARGDCNTSANNDALAIPAMRRSNSDTSLELEREHVLSPRIVEAVTHSTQVVWANCQRSEGLLGRSDVRLQTAIGMPVGVDEFGNVWVVVMFSPMNVESSADAIDYLKYISRSAATTRIPCLLPVWGGAEMMTTTTTDALGVARSRRSKTSNMICSEKDDSNRDAEDDEVDHHNNHHRSLVSITPRPNLSDHTEELGEGVIAKFVSFKIDDDDDDEIENVHVNDRPSQMMGVEEGFKSVFDNDVRKAPKDDWGIPMLPTETDVKRKHTLTISTANTNPTSAPFSSPSPTPTTYSNNYLDAIDDVITDAFDDASYGVWSTIMNSSGMSATSDADEERSCSSSNRRGNNVGTSISTSSASIFGNSKFARLEEFAAAFLGMSVFDVADVWTMGGNSQQHEDGTGNVATNHPMHLECLFTVAATNTNPQINALRSASMNASIEVADGVVGRAYNSGCSVWSSIKVRRVLIYHICTADGCNRLMSTCAFCWLLFRRLSTIIVDGRHSKTAK